MYDKKSLLISPLFVLASSCGSTLLLANETAIQSTLNEELQQTTVIATQNNQNIDYQPFILSVWEQEQLTAFGVKTLKDALLLMPGIDMMGDTMNNRTPVIRGSNPLAYGQTKLAIDGVVVNDRTFDSYNGYLDLPIELIERIEVVRGAGSFLEGVNGYSGSINVITYANGTLSSRHGSLFGSFGSDHAKQAGFWYNQKGDNWKLSTDIFYQKHDAISPIDVTDKYGNIGRVPLNSEQLGIGLSYLYRNFSLKGRINQFESGSAFGNLNAIPNMEGYQKLPSWYLEGSYRQNISDHISVNMKAGIMEDGWESNARSLPAGTYLGVTYPAGYWASLDFNTRTLYQNISANYTGFKNHTVTIGYTHKYEDVIDISSITTNRTTGGPDLVDYTITAPFIDAGAACRHTNEFYLYDTIDLSDQLALSLHAGGTKASQIDFEPYARAALVYQPHRQHILKAMVANGYRLPSFQELYTLNNPARIGNPNLESERVTSYEMQYLYKPTLDLTFGINLFYLRNKDQITANTTDKVYQNIGQRNILGMESELRGSFGANDLITLSYSYIEGETIKGAEYTDYLPYASSHMLKGAVSYALTPSLKSSVVGRFNSAKERRPNDVRTDAMNSISTLDFIVGWEDPSGFYLQGAIKNLNNAILRYPSPPSTYPDDYPIEGRTFWIRSGWKF